jgi:hypothetical protein
MKLFVELAELLMGRLDLMSNKQHAENVFNTNCNPSQNTPVFSAGLLLDNIS